MKLQLGQPAPDFTLPSHLGKDITLSSLRGKNVVMAFFPLAWTPIWTAQIPSYQAEMARFEGLDTQVLGISVDSVPCLTAWAESLGGISYPLLSDFWPHGELAERYGVLRSEGHSERALFLINKQGILCYQEVVDIGTQPDNEKLRAVLRAVDPAAAAREPKPKPVQAGLPQGGIVMYCTRWCPDCKKARAWLAAQNLPYTEVDIYATAGAEDQVRKWCGGSLVTPTFDINGTIVIDFNEEQLRQVLQHL